MNAKDSMPLNRRRLLQCAAAGLVWVRGTAS